MARSHGRRPTKGARQTKGSDLPAWKPLPGPQTRFLSLTCGEALYGGAAGGGKSDSLLIDAVRYVGRGYGANYHALLLRRTYPEISKSLIKRSKQLYPLLGGIYNKTDHVWTFPGGELVEFGHAQHEDSIENYQGGALQYVGWDEATTFTPYQYLYLFSRCRSAHGVPCRIRGATNPGGESHDFFFERYAPWLDQRPEYKGPKALPGQVLYFVRDEAGGQERVVPKGTPGALGRTFVPAQLEDNPFLFNGGAYARGLLELDPVTYARQRNGDWLTKPGKGLYFRRAMFADRFVAAAPIHVKRRLRYWDRAATVDGDWTVGTKMSLDLQDVTTVEDVVRFRGDPGTVEANIKATAEADGKAIRQCLEQDPGSAGLAEVLYLIKALKGFDARRYPKRANKVVAAGPFSAQCAVSNVRIVRAPWNEVWLVELEAFPEGKNDDQVDSAGGGYAALLSEGVSVKYDPQYDEDIPNLRI